MAHLVAAPPGLLPGAGEGQAHLPLDCRHLLVCRPLRADEILVHGRGGVPAVMVARSVMVPVMRREPGNVAERDTELPGDFPCDLAAELLKLRFHLMRFEGQREALADRGAELDLRGPPPDPLLVPADLV